MSDHDRDVEVGFFRFVVVTAFVLLCGLVVFLAAKEKRHGPCEDTYRPGHAEVECDPRAQIEVGADADGKTIVVCRCEREKP